MIKIALDLLGADTSEEELCLGALDAIKEKDGLSLILYGHKEKLAPIVAASGADTDRIIIEDCHTTVTNYDSSITAYTQSEASICRAMKAAADREDIHGVVTCGSTGAVLVSSIMILGKIKGMRPVLAVELKNMEGKPLLLLDCGANIDSRAELLVTFAHIGDSYMRSIGYANPRISLLSNGAEDTKGCESVKEANKLLKEAREKSLGALNFIGNIEATGALLGFTDVIVCDGFHGNIMLKCIEGTAKAALDEARDKLTSSMTAISESMGIAGDADSKKGEYCKKIREAVLGAIADVRRKYDYNTQGGAVLIGANKLVMKGHGSATGEAVKNMLLRIYTLAENDFVGKIRTIYDRNK